MKKVLAILTVLLITTIVTTAQHDCKKENLKQLSVEQLDQCQQKIRKNLYLGSEIILIGMTDILFASLKKNETDKETTSFLYPKFYMSSEDRIAAITIGTIVCIFGTAIIAESSSRLKKINEIKISRTNDLSIELVPVNFHCQYSQNYCQGISVRFTF